jgi:DNA-binding transcriptional ArsR family regulator/uncharacterized protein YndB with AHSA1/START domain
MVNSNITTVFSSLADDTRSDIMQRLVAGPLTIKTLAADYDMSLPAVSKHINILVTAGLIVKERQGRQHIVRLAPGATSAASDHLDQYRTTLSNRLESFRQYVEGGKPVSQAAVKNARPAAQKQELQSSVVVNSAVEDVWRMYTSPSDMVHWTPFAGMHIVHCENRVEFAISGVYKEVDLYKKLVYSDGIGEPAEARPEALVTIKFESLPGKKTLLTRVSVAPAAVHQINAAWLKAMEQS